MKGVDAYMGGGVGFGLPASVAVSVRLAGPNAAVGAPPITQFAPFGVTVMPAGRPRMLHAVRGGMPFVVVIVRL